MAKKVLENFSWNLARIALCAVARSEKIIASRNVHQIFAPRGTGKFKNGY